MQGKEAGECNNRESSLCKIFKNNRKIQLFQAIILIDVTKGKFKRAQSYSDSVVVIDRDGN